MNFIFGTGVMVISYRTSPWATIIFAPLIHRDPFCIFSYVRYGKYLEPFAWHVYLCLFLVFSASLVPVLPLRDFSRKNTSGKRTQRNKKL